MKLKKLVSIKVVTGSLLMIAISVTSCKKEIETTPNSEAPRGIETWKTLEDYPSEITLDNWEEFIYAPDDVITHFVEKERLESCANISPKSMTTSIENTQQTSPPIFGLIQFYQANIETPQFINFPNVTVSNCNNQFLSIVASPGAILNYVLPGNCSSNDQLLCMAVDQPTISDMSQCNLVEPFAGVTTLDILLIQKHILGLQVITEPAQLIAADVNRDGSITGMDIIQVRKMILGYYFDWPNSDNYVFINNSYYNSFTTLSSLYSTEDIVNNINAMDPCQHVSNVDRIGVKTGDVNGSLANCF